MAAGAWDFFADGADAGSKFCELGEISAIFACSTAFTADLILSTAKRQNFACGTGQVPPFRAIHKESLFSLGSSLDFLSLICTDYIHD